MTTTTGIAVTIPGEPHAQGRQRVRVEVTEYDA